MNGHSVAREVESTAAQLRMAIVQAFATDAVPGTLSSHQSAYCQSTQASIERIRLEPTPAWNVHRDLREAEALEISVARDMWGERLWQWLPHLPCWHAYMALRLFMGCLHNCNGGRDGDPEEWVGLLLHAAQRLAPFERELCQVYFEHVHNALAKKDVGDLRATCYIAALVARRMCNLTVLRQDVEPLVFDLSQQWATDVFEGGCWSIARLFNEPWMGELGTWLSEAVDRV